jgi:hypothetical protein
MKMMTVTSGFIGVLAAAALGSSATAAADPPSLNGNAADVVKMLQDHGYNVQFNMPSNMTLSRCTVDGVHGLPLTMTPDGNLMMMMAPTSGVGSVFVDLSCPPSNN